uniref:Fe2OG dioxygenase domain-containing protein n=1 Tax=Pyrodinium bahamense TaxID=73915 RepID=A0A7S0AXR4_9DINO
MSAADAAAQHKLLDYAKQNMWGDIRKAVAERPELILLVPKPRDFGLIHQAAFFDNADAARFLLELEPRAAEHLSSRSRQTALDVARAEHGAGSIVLTFLERGDNAEVLLSKLPLQEAVERATSDLRHLLNMLHTPRRTRRAGALALVHRAVVEGHATALARLLEAGADPQLPDSQGMSAVDHAQLVVHPHCLAVLERHEAAAQAAREAANASGAAPNNPTGSKLFKELLPETREWSSEKALRSVAHLQTCFSHSGFSVRDVLTKQECEEIIAAAEGVGFSSTRGEYPEEYRSSDRVLWRSPQLAKALWARMLPHCVEELSYGCRPMGFGNSGHWQPRGLNDVFKVARYTQGKQFVTHMDGPWIPREDFASVFTVLIYLNENFEGGETAFEVAADFFEDDGSFVSIKPKAGAALVFPHQARHCGKVVSAGRKYTLRTEIMFQRDLSDDHRRTEEELYGYESDERYQRMAALYAQAEEHEQRGNPALFVNTYLQALDIQAAQRELEMAKEAASAGSLGHWERLPHRLRALVLRFVGAPWVLQTSAVSRTFKAALQADGDLWMGFFGDLWPELLPFELAYLRQRGAQLALPWCAVFRHRYLAKIKRQVAFVVQLGPVWATYGAAASSEAVVMRSRAPTSSAARRGQAGDPLGPVVRRCPSKVAVRYERVSHIRSRKIYELAGTKYSRFETDDKARCVQPDGTLSDVRGPLLLEAFLRQLGLHGHRHPVLVVCPPKADRSSMQILTEPFNSFDQPPGSSADAAQAAYQRHCDEAYQLSPGGAELARCLFSRFQVPAVAFVEAPPLCLMAHGREDGIVVCYDSPAPCYVAAVVGGRTVAVKGLPDLQADAPDPELVLDLALLAWAEGHGESAAPGLLLTGAAAALQAGDADGDSDGFTAAASADTAASPGPFAEGLRAAALARGACQWLGDRGGDVCAAVRGGVLYSETARFLPSLVWATSMTR